MISLAVTITVVLTGAQFAPPSTEGTAPSASRAIIDGRAAATFTHPPDRSGPLVRKEPLSSDRRQRSSRSDSRTALPAWLAGCKSRDLAQNHQNGQLPRGELCELPPSSQLLHPDAARDWWRLNRQYRLRFGQPLCVTDSYRSYEAQSRLFAVKPGLAAIPGTSNHGWGVAVDLCGGIEDFGSPTHQWLREHGPKFGWDNPGWARPDGSRPEPWHWEYDRDSIGGRDGPAI